jgi:two-component system, OmpR family, response regulator
MRILVVEDSAKMSALLRKGLEREGYRVDVVHNGTDAVWIADANEYDAIVLDVILAQDGPLADGFEVCRLLRHQGCWAPVLMVTARDAIEDRVNGLDAGADDYLPKPFSFEELVARLRALIRRGAPERPAVLALDDLRLDPASHEVHRGDAKIDLTPTEFALLEYLMRNEGRALTRTELVQHVWDESYDGDLRIVNVHVKALRDKIDRPFGRSTVGTVRGVGYRMQVARG